MPQLCPFSSPQLLEAGFQHGFFGRVGGASQGAFASLNCSFSVGDEACCVSENLNRIASYFGVATGSLAAVSQVHGANVVDVDGLACEELAKCEADALLGATQARVLCIRTADCVPILVGSRDTGAAAAIHAGWRGIVSGVVPQAVNRLLELGGRPDGLIVAIGPHIGGAAFEVSPEVAAALNAVAPHVEAVVQRDDGRPKVHLADLVLAQLQSSGVPLSRVDSVGSCTYLNEKDFFSYRRDGSRSGRQLSAIRPLRTGDSHGPAEQY